MEQEEQLTNKKHIFVKQVETSLLLCFQICFLLSRVNFGHHECQQEVFMFEVV